MENKVNKYLSFSGSNDFLNCPAKFAHRRIWKTVVEEELPGEPILVGNSIHAWLQNEEYEHELITKEIQNKIDNIISSWENSLEATKPFYDAIKKQLESEHEFLYLSSDNNINKNVMSLAPNMKIKGFIDIVATNDNEEVTLVEIKTGKNPYPKKYMDQIDLYVAVWNQLYPENKATRKMLVTFKSEPPYTVKVHEWPLSSEEQNSIEPIIRMEKIWNDIEKAIEDNCFAVNPSYLCNWCNYEAVCTPFGRGLQNLIKK
jgi:putative RecB family exonuclease